MEVETERGPGLAWRDVARVLKMRTDAALPSSRRAVGQTAAWLAGSWLAAGPS